MAGIEVSHARAEAERFVTEHSAEIERVARGLLRWETLDFSEIEWLMKGEHAFAEIAAVRALRA